MLTWAWGIVLHSWCSFSRTTALSFLPTKNILSQDGLFPSSVQFLPRPMLNSTGVRYPLLFCSKLSKTVSSCSGVRGSSLWSRCKDRRMNKVEAWLKSSLWLSVPSSALAHSNEPFQPCILPRVRHLPVQLSDDTNSCLEPLICWLCPLLDDSTRTSKREFQVILFGEGSTRFLPHYRSSVSSSLPASLHSCSEVALPASCDHCCSQESSGHIRYQLYVFGQGRGSDL